jgi:hypothetical protein
MNAIVRELEVKLETIQAWRHHMHQHPELSFEEVNTSVSLAVCVVPPTIVLPCAPQHSLCLQA